MLKDDKPLKNLEKEVRRGPKFKKMYTKPPTQEIESKTVAETLLERRTKKKRIRALQKRYIHITSENLAKLPPIYQEIVRLINDEGLSWEKACVAVGYSPTTKSRIKKRISKYSISSTKMEKKAYTVFSDILDNKTKVSEVAYVIDKKTGKKIKLVKKHAPDFSHQLTAATAVIDRTQPIPRGPLVVNNNNFSPVNLDKYRNKELRALGEGDVRDITP